MSRVFFYTLKIAAHIAQSVEHFLGKEEVTGSIPVVGTIKMINISHYSC